MAAIDIVVIVINSTVLCNVLILILVSFFCVKDCGKTRDLLAGMCSL